MMRFKGLRPWCGARYGLGQTLAAVMAMALGLGVATSALAEGPDPRNVRFEAWAAKAPRGHYPRYFLREQSYFTVAGSDGGGPRSGLLNADGALEVDRGGFSVEPFLQADGEFVTWNEVRAEPALERGDLPLPAVTWHWRGLDLTTSAFAAAPGGGALFARYRLNNGRDRPVKARLCLAIRPFQVNPPWQSLNMVGGIAPIREIRRDGRLIRVDRRALIPLNPPDRFGALPLAGGNLAERLQRGDRPTAESVRDPAGFASAVLAYDIALPSRGWREIFLAIPFGSPEHWLSAQPPGPLDGEFGVLRHRETAAGWAERLRRAELILPPTERPLAHAVRSNLAYILVQREGAALHPGTRTYARTWVRDGAMISSALLGYGFSDEVRQFLRWFAPFQFPDGKIPCCVDGRGADSTPENDSHGEFIYTLAEYWRYTRDRALVRELWPAVARTVVAIDALRRQRMTSRYRNGDKRVFFGLMPESISHEGYAARPVHAFWDDFWTLRGLDDAALLAAEAGADPAPYARLRDEFRHDLSAALDATMARHHLGYLPASVELGDFDVNATAIAVNLDESAHLPTAALKQTFDEYRQYVLKRRAGAVAWDAYTPYEVRSVEALTRLGRRNEAQDLLDFLREGQRPPAWNHWAEVVWKDPQAPKFIGDMPHAWIGAEFVRAIRSLFAYERADTLVLAAGLPAAWLDAPAGVGVRDLPTGFGRLSYRIRRTGPAEIRVRLEGGLALPAGGLRIRPPASAPILAVKADGRPLRTFTAEEVTLKKKVPTEVVMSY